MELSNLPNLTRERKDSMEIKRILVGVAGGSGAGKSYFCSKVLSEIHYTGHFKVTIISLDDFYKTLDQTKCSPSEYNFDHPDALDFDYAYQVLNDLMEGKQAKIPVYSFKLHKRTDEYQIVDPTDIILFEGIFALFDEKVRDLMTYKIFMHCDDDIRLCRRLLRDTKERGRTVVSILDQYNKFVKKAFDEYIKPTMSFADLIVPGSRRNTVAVELIVHELKTQARQIGIYKKTLQKEAVYIGDLIEENLIQYQDQGIRHNNSQYVVQEKTTAKKFLFLPTQDEQKREIINIWLSLKDNVTVNRSKKVFKEFTKMGVKMWGNICSFEELDPSQCKCVQLQSFMIQSIDPSNHVFLNTQCFEKYNLVIIPVLYKGEFLKQLYERLSKYENILPGKEIILIILFSKIGILNSFRKFPFIRNVINLLCIGKMEKFEETMNDIKESSITFDPFDPFLHQAKIVKRVTKSLQKIQEKKKKL